MNSFNDQVKWTLKTIQVGHCFLVYRHRAVCDANDAKQTVERDYSLNDS